jgi:hypothetical protein
MGLEEGSSAARWKAGADGLEDIFIERIKVSVLSNWNVSHTTHIFNSCYFREEPFRKAN